MSSYQIKKINKEEFDILIPLMLDCFGMEVDINYFKWKFIDNPAGIVEGYVALSESNEVAAYYGVIPESYWLNGELKTIYQSCDTMTHSSHRRKGLFKKLALHCFEELRRQDKLFVIGFSGVMSTPGFLKFGFKKVFDMKYYFIFNVPLLYNRQVSNDIHEIEDLIEIKHLLLKSNNGGMVRSDKSIESFKWRISNPLYDYKLIGLKSNDCFESYLCYYQSEDKIILFDFYFSSISQGKLMIQYLKSKVKEMKLKGIISFVQENSTYSKSLKKVGFWSNPFPKGPLSSKVPFILFAPDNELNRYATDERWLINSFDHDAM